MLAICAKLDFAHGINVSSKDSAYFDGGVVLTTLESTGFSAAHAASV